MNLYTHYKNKPYRVLGEARHSETLEMLVLYETRYKNELGRLWVRPKEMFYSDVEVAGKKVKRFAPVEISYSMEGSEKFFKEATSVLEQVLPDFSVEKFQSALKSHREVKVWMAYHNDQPVACKVGYAIDSEKFYSWLGGVIPGFQGGGIAKELMRMQHEWCENQGFQRIETRTKNSFKKMLLLNIRAGFQIVGTQQNKHGSLKIILEKNLAKNE